MNAAGLDPLVVRSLALFAPAAALAYVWHRRRPNSRQIAGGVQAGLWCFISLFALHLTALRWGWWHYETVGGLLAGLPIDLWIGWALAWGPLPAWALPRASIVGIAAGVAAIDIAVVPLLAPTVQVGPWWLVGEAASVCFCLVPGLLVGRWTADERRLVPRVSLQVVAFGLLLAILVPAASLVASGTELPAFAAGPVSVEALMASIDWRSWPARLLVLPAMVGLGAVYEFVRRGGGTPVPWDPPPRLVVSGPYAYVANPMQIAAIGFIALVGAAAGSNWIVAAAAWSFFATVGLIARNEEGALSRRFGSDWRRYRRNVRNWIPRWRPWHPSLAGGPPARVYVSFGCAECSTVGRFIEALQPVGLEVRAAEDHPTRDLRRITYDPMDGCAEDEGVGAIGRVLEHVNLGLALVGTMVRLPVVRHCLQALVDGAGYGPMRVARTCPAPRE